MAGWYVERVLPKLIDLACASPGFRPHRAAVVAGTRGTVLELGFGSGHNLRAYPATVEKLIAVEPSVRAIEIARDRIAAAAFDVEVIEADGARLPMPDSSVDCVVSTFTLCTIPDVAGALAEVKRVLRPGGTFHVLEHGLADDVRVQRLQRIVDPVHRRVAGGCHTTRHMPALLDEAGFRWDALSRWYEGRPKVLTALTMVIATVSVD
ncbi:MAG: class I SAM-dependent methyltransferase [Ilumatobacteraceae bacterium]